MYDILLQIYHDTEILRASTISSDDDGPIFWLAGPIGAVGFYSYIFLRYRNTNKRHEYEHKTHAELGQITAYDQKVGEVKGVERSTISNENKSNPRLRLGQGSTFVESWRQG